MSKGEEKKRIVKYSNQLNLNKLGFLKSVSQDIFINILTEFNTKRSTYIEIPLSKLKEHSRLSKQTDEYFKSRLIEVHQDLLKQLIFTIMCENGDIYSAPLFSFFVTTSDGVLRTKINEKFCEALFAAENYFTKFSTEQFIDVRGKYTKSLYRLFRKNFKGKKLITYCELKEWLCLPKNYPTNNLKRILQKSIDELKKKEIVEDAKFKFNYGTTKGRPLESIFFEYSFKNPDISEEITK